MNDIDTLATFFGWCTVVNFGIYLLTVGALLVFRNLAYRINARIFGITEAEAGHITMQYVGHYKLAITLLCFVPWVALKIMS